MSNIIIQRQVSLHSTLTENVHSFEPGRSPTYCLTTSVFANGEIFLMIDDNKELGRC